MKKIGCFLCVALLLCVSTAVAERDNAGLKNLASSMLTEVYGYTAQDAEAFTYEMTDDGDLWTVRYYLNPAWAYEMTVRKSDGGWEDSKTPFTTLYQGKAPENSVRYTLYAIADNGWFDSWNVETKAAFAGVLAWCGDIHVTDSLRNGLQTDGYTPAQALQDFFVSCYGDEAQWSAPVAQWRDAEFARYNLIREDSVFTVPQGVATRTELKPNGRDKVQVCEYAGVVPQELAQAFSDPELASWMCLAGAYRISETGIEGAPPEADGLAAFARGDEWLLVRLALDAKTNVWSAVYVSETALLPGRDLYITYSTTNRSYGLHYPVSDTVEESFQCRVSEYFTTMDASDSVTACQLIEYRLTDLQEKRTLVIDSGYMTGNTGWYTVTETMYANSITSQYPALVTPFLEYLDASAFPTTEEACETAASHTAAIPEGYAVTNSVHLRDQTSSHSKDLGMYLRGTLVQVLDTVPGSSYPWYHVRIGNVEGYMSGNYVEYGSEMSGIASSAVPCMAKTKGKTALKDKTNTFAQTLQDLPQGTLLRVLAKSGNWLHVSLPADDSAWLMQPGEACGYVQTNAVVMGVSGRQIDWLMARQPRLNAR